VRSNERIAGAVRNDARTWLHGAGVLLLSIGVAGCGGNGTAQAQRPPAASPPTIDVVRVLEQPVDVVLAMPGQLDPYETVAVYPKVTGFVKRVRVDRGSRVRTGELLAQLEAPELVAQRAEALSKSQAAQAQLAVVRAKADADAGTYDRLKAASVTPGVVAGNDLVVAQKALEADQNQISAARQNAEAARQALQSITQMEGYLRVTAPFDGVVTERNVHPGTLVGPNSGPAATTPMLRVVHNDQLRLVVPVPEAYIAGVNPGVAMSFTVPAYPGNTFSGTVARIAHAVDVKTRTMAVELDVMNRDGRLAPGTFCQVQWPLRRPTPSLFVPSGSVGSTTDRTFVVRIRSGKTEWVDVRTGLASGALVEVFGDLRAGDEVAVRGTDEIRPGTEVRVKEVKPTTP
jgi:RND family efflux transporter MFP subunit